MVKGVMGRRGMAEEVMWGSDEWAVEEVVR